MKMKNKCFYRAWVGFFTIAVFGSVAPVTWAQSVEQAPVSHLPATIGKPVGYEAVPVPDAWPKPLDDSKSNSLFLIDLLEYQINDGDNTLRWDAQGWVGGDYNRLWFKSEGDATVSSAASGESDVQLLYGRLIAPFWDFQIGGRYEQAWGAGNDPSRFSAAIGLQGLAPYWFELEPTLYISQDGDVSAELTASYDFLITQRLVLQPRLDTTVAVQEVSQFGVGQGFNDIELGLRLRYEIKREFAPYIGVVWKRLLGQTAHMANDDGEDTNTLSLVLGIRMWF